MSVSNGVDNWNKHWEGLVFISLEDRKEVIILKEAHGSISNLLNFPFKICSPNAIFLLEDEDQQCT